MEKIEKIQKIALKQDGKFWKFMAPVRRTVGRREDCHCDFIVKGIRFKSEWNGMCTITTSSECKLHNINDGSE